MFSYILKHINISVPNVNGDNVNQLYAMYCNQKYYLMGHFFQWKLMQRKLYDWILEYLSIMSMLFL